MQVIAHEYSLLWDRSMTTAIKPVSLNHGQNAYIQPGLWQIHVQLYIHPNRLIIILFKLKYSYVEIFLSCGTHINRPIINVYIERDACILWFSRFKSLPITMIVTGVCRHLQARFYGFFVSRRAVVSPPPHSVIRTLYRGSEYYTEILYMKIIRTTNKTTE